MISMPDSLNHGRGKPPQYLARWLQRSFLSHTYLRICPEYLCWNRILQVCPDLFAFSSYCFLSFLDAFLALISLMLSPLSVWTTTKRWSLWEFPIRRTCLLPWNARDHKWPGTKYLERPCLLHQRKAHESQDFFLLSLGPIQIEALYSPSEFHYTPITIVWQSKPILVMRNEKVSRLVPTMKSVSTLS